MVPEDSPQIRGTTKYR